MFSYVLLFILYFFFNQTVPNAFKIKEANIINTLENVIHAKVKLTICTQKFKPTIVVIF